MNEANFIKDLSNLLEIEANELIPSFNLASSGVWDSLSIVSAIALIDEHFKISVGIERVFQCCTVGDLLSLAGPA